MEKSDDTISHYAEFISARCNDEGLLPFDASAVARVIEFGARVSGNKEKLTAKFNDIGNLITEAAYWAKKDKNTTVSSAHVLQARKEKIYRDSKIEDKLQEYIVDGTLMVDVEGEVVGQINGLAVLSMGDYTFGKPSRITAKTYMGEKGVVNIEREVKMSGRIHNKALMILTSFLGERFAQKFPLTLSASICFEQLYDGIEGDSATCTELYALLSSLSGLPLNQSIAVTGSMNQKGEVQPIGGVNEKIEGFFDVCDSS
jgi:predicted ATP-dependent protease